MKVLLGLLIVLLLFIQYQLWFSSSGVTETWRLKRTLSTQNKENKQLSQRNLHLEKEIRELKTTHSMVESLARSKLGMVKKGEVYYRIVKVRENNENINQQ